MVDCNVELGNRMASGYIWDLSRCNRLEENTLSLARSCFHVKDILDWGYISAFRSVLLGPSRNMLHYIRGSHTSRTSNGPMDQYKVVLTSSLEEKYLCQARVPHP